MNISLLILSNELNRNTGSFHSKLHSFAENMDITIDRQVTGLQSLTFIDSIVSGDIFFSAMF